MSLGFWIFCFSTPSFSAEPRPPELQDIGIQDRLGNVIPLNLEFTDEKGKTIPLKTYFDGARPVILALVYYECPNLCGYLLKGATEGFSQLAWNIGEQYDVVFVSIDPKETPILAAGKKVAFLKEYWRLRENGDRGRGPAQRVAEEVPEGVAGGGHFLVGKEKDIQTLAKEVGFKFRFDPTINQFAHPAALFIFTPQGKLARVLQGIEFSPRDLRLALTEAGQGKIGTIVDRLLLLCYRYNTKMNKYTLFASNLMKVSGAVTLLALGFFILRLGRKRA